MDSSRGIARVEGRFFFQEKIWICSVMKKIQSYIWNWKCNVTREYLGKKDTNNECKKTWIRGWVIVHFRNSKGYFFPRNKREEKDYWCQGTSWWDKEGWGSLPTS